MLLDIPNTAADGPRRGAVHREITNVSRGRSARGTGRVRRGSSRAVTAHAVSRPGRAARVRRSDVPATTVPACGSLSCPPKAPGTSRRWCRSSVRCGPGATTCWSCRGLTPKRWSTISDLGEFIVSCRPGRGTTPTEGDIARWTRWSVGDHPPRNWLIADGRRFRSVRDVVETLRMRVPMPDEEMISGDWWFPDLAEATSRGEIRANWAETVRRNKRFWKT